MSNLTSKKEALEYHALGRPGKIEVVPTKPCLTQIDLSLAYSPGVAEPCREIAKDPAKVYDYTAKGNLVAVVSDGSAVLGLGNLGPLGAKPVMEGKGVLFKRFADIDVFDIELDVHDVEGIVAAVKAISPTFAGINLEDIGSPICFEVEKRLRQELDIPVFHDDQHGTAVIAAAALINAADIAGKKLDELKLVVSGAGASALACARSAVEMGVQAKNIILCDSKGVLWKGRPEGMNRWKEPFANETEARTLADALVNADAFYGLSVADVMSPEMLSSMAANPIVFAMANPDPEITWELAHETRDDVIMATGRSDYPNQANNVLGFPFIFRGALDVGATTINRSMLRAAANALAELARDPVPDVVAHAYGKDALEFGRDYFIPKALDHRVIRRVAAAVAEAAMETGVARHQLDMETYVRQLGERIGEERELMRRIVSRARRDPKRIVYPEGDADRILIAAEAVISERIASPILIGDADAIRAKAEKFGYSLDGVEIVDPETHPRLEEFREELFRIRQHRGASQEDAAQRILDPMWFGPMMVRMGEADGMVCGVTREVRKTMPPMLKVIPLRPGVRRACGLSMIFRNDGTLFLADTSVNIELDSEGLAEVTLLAADAMRKLGVEPRAALLSFSSYGGTPHPRSDMVRQAVALAREEDPTLIVDGEMRVDAALDPTVQTRYEKSILGGKPANLLIFPSLEAANIGLNLVRTMTDAPVVGPVMCGLDRPAHMLQPHSAGVSDVVRLTAIASLDAALSEAQRATVPE